MRYEQNGTLGLAATDLVGHLTCHHLSALNARVARGEVAPPPYREDPHLEALIERGRAHEEAYVAHLRASGLTVTEVPGIDATDVAIGHTRAAMAEGVGAIVQGALARAGWRGRADVLLRVKVPSSLGGWSYEAVDTKLAQETKIGTILQLCVYSDLLGEEQGVVPEFMSVVTPWSGFERERFRFADFAAFYRRAAFGLAAFRERDHTTYPEPTPYCDRCRWRSACAERWRADDHLSLVAGATRLQTTELTSRGISTVKALADEALPLSWRPERGAAESYVRIREQARIQVEGRDANAPRFELLAGDKAPDMFRLPPPSQGDVFFDLEGDPFVGEGGLEYLFGYVCADANGEIVYRHAWAHSRAQEKAAFTDFMDFLTARLAQFPDLHVYHYAPYEPAALKRLMGRYAAREEEMDGFLRGGLFVDLFSVVRHSIRASVESYSLKALEAFYGFQRTVDLREVGRAKAALEARLELDDAGAIGEAEQDVVRAYNEDDCRSTARLRDWLEEQRSTLLARGVEVPRPVLPEDGAPNPNVAAWLEKIAPIVAQLAADVPVDVAERTVEQHSRWILAHLLDWHRREQKAVWWEYFRLAELPEDEFFFERAAVGGLEFVESVGGTAAVPIHRYRFPQQDVELREKSELRSVGGGKLGKLEGMSSEHQTIDVKKTKDTADHHPTAVFGHTFVPTDVIAGALFRIGEHVAMHGLMANGPYAAACDLLMRARPRTTQSLARAAGETTLDVALRLATGLTAGVLPIQGPPGTGKTYTGARMICALVAQGLRVGVTANSHKVIAHLIDEVIRLADEHSTGVQCCIKADEMHDDRRRLRYAKTNNDVFGALRAGANVAGGTVWMWANADAAGSVDVLFVDEAAQMSLANVLAASQAAPRLVLLGDPQQLGQPLQGSHPDGCEVSALHHILAGRQTIEPDQGIFLEETWRLHPDICAFTSEVFYAGKLHARPGRDRQEVRSSIGVTGSGLRYLPVTHRGNQNASAEEAHVIANLVNGMLAHGATWVDAEGAEHRLNLDDFLIITPYNAQVQAIQRALPGARIGTVDKFQGREAPVAIYSTASSSYADAPRGMDFLYSLNRLNVATSRAKCLSVLVASPAIFDPECRSPAQMRWANAFCRFLELAGSHAET